MCALALLGCSPKTQAPIKPTVQVAGGLIIQMTVTSASGPPHSGDNTLSLVISNAATGAPVGDANVTVWSDMTAPSEHGQANSGRAQGNGAYQVPLRLPIATKYNLQVEITQRGGQPPVDVTFPLDVSQ